MRERASVAAEYRFCTWPVAKADVTCDGFAVGGKRILDLVARNKAIKVMQVKSYLSLDMGRPLAAYMTDLIVNSAIQDPQMMLNVSANTFLQMFTVNTNQNSKLPQHVARMLKTAKDLGVQFEMAAPCVEVLEKIPIWHHFGTKEKAHKMNNMEQNICLRMNHGVEYVGEALAIDVAAAVKLLDHLQPRWDPCEAVQDDSLGLSEETKAQNLEA
ncbi:hypothetical protein ARMGADRAFT_1038755 [Armillaria gallica]|uniref:Uncharacterized protein n=1 Tax=Armillaria gallica TaxID=47427 RepID=A0A2H3CK99_ARMGA|nr:hypothetical protein ARMGADRAFT_1038755 [Armillaria gallica]